ncbi:MAG TPA: hypothetical protein VG146_08315 [Verrucomicrobiae bacterium]|nr:hypothetical protein [Verrucomicrobiae bacterium]
MSIGWRHSPYNALANWYGASRTLKKGHSNFSHKFNSWFDYNYDVIKR